MGTLKYIKLLLHRYTPSTCQIYHKWIVHEHKFLSSFLFFRFQSFVNLRERERERERVYKIGYKEKPSQSYLSYLDGFLWRIFLLSRALLLPGVLGFSSVRHEPCPTTNFLIIYFHWQAGVPTSVLGSQPIVWLLPSSFPCQATRVKSPSTSICWSSLWPTLFLNGHSLTACYC